jgi:hypothetical protein
MIKNIILIIIIISLISTNAQADWMVLPQTLDITGIEVLTGLILGATGTIWVVRKLIKTINRS